jgi:hypothetical protein
LAILLLIAAAAVRLVIVFRERSATPEEAKVEAPPLEADYYVSPRKLHDYDVKSLRQDLVGRTVWVKEGYRYSIYPVDAAGKRADLKRAAGTAAPIEKLDITAVMTAPTPSTPSQQQVLAVFRRGNAAFALPVGVLKGSNATIFADEIFFYEDPRQLYKHWPAGTWEAVTRHEVRSGMNEFQVGFAAGMGIPEPSAGAREKVVHYPNGGHPLTVTYRDGHAIQISQD